MDGPGSTTVVTAPGAAVTAALRATYLAFFGAGFAFANWASRIPQLRDLLDLSAAQLGWVLVAVAVGALIALPLSGAIVHRLGSRRTVVVAALLLAVGLLAVGSGTASPSLGVPVVVAGLAVFGFANGAWDVAMNVQGAQVERLVQRSLLPRMHAGFSLGTVAGALIGAGMVATGVSVQVHLSLVALLAVVVVPRGVRAFLPEPPPSADADAGAHADAGDGPGTSGTARRSFWTAWREPRTLLVGLLVLAFALAEGIGNDWIGIALIDGHGTSPATSALGFAAFVTAMTVGRWSGPNVLDRYGRVPVVGASLALALLGLLLFVAAPSVPLAFVGLFCWGLGASLGFPVGMSAAADEPDHAASRVSVVASIGYCGFLAGPPVIGLLGEEVTVLHALLALAAPLVLAVLVLPSLRPPQP